MDSRGEILSRFVNGEGKGIGMLFLVRVVGAVGKHKARKEERGERDRETTVETAKL